MGNILTITFLGPASVDEVLSFDYYGLFPATTVFTRNETAKTTRVNPGEFTIGTDAVTQAQFYETAFFTDYASVYFTVSRVGAVVTITSLNGSNIFNPTLSAGSSVFATFSISSNVTITIQPAANSLNVAYRPIVFRSIIPTTTLDIPPVVYCDIYINGTYYKTLSKTQYLQLTGGLPEYEFDIQDALQEVMSYNLPAMDGDAILEVDKTVRKAFVKFRNAALDSDGFIVSEQLEPIQATSSNVAVQGGGLESNEFYVYNATLQHEDNQDFAQFLSSYRTGTWDADSYPLTKRPKTIKLCKNDSSYFPITTDKDVTCLRLNYKLAGGTYQTVATCDPPPPTFEYSYIVACQEYTWPVTGLTYTDSDEFAVTIGSVTYVLYLTICAGTSDEVVIDTITASGSYTWPKNGQTYTASGNFVIILSSCNGFTCTYYLELTIT